MNRTSTLTSSREFWKVVAFGCVGLGAFLTYLLSVAIVVESGGHPILGAVAGFTTGTVVSFYGNCRWVFRVEPSGMLGGRFFIVTLLGLLANIGLAALLTYWGVHYVLMTVIIFIVVPIFNYLGHRFWTFTHSDPGLDVGNA